MNQKLSRASILKSVNNSVLVLKFFNDDSSANLKREAANRGIAVSDDPQQSQLIFMPGAGAAEHIQKKAMCDVYLDVKKN